MIDQEDNLPFHLLEHHIDEDGSETVIGASIANHMPIIAVWQREGPKYPWTCDMTDTTESKWRSHHDYEVEVFGGADIAPREPFPWNSRTTMKLPTIPT